MFPVRAEQNESITERDGGRGSQVKNPEGENTKTVRKYLEKQVTTQHSKSLDAVNRELCSVNASAPKGRSPINTVTRHCLNKPSVGKQVKEIIKLGVEMIGQETGKNQQRRVSAFEKVSNSH